jgi:hypothetical protein
MKTPEIIELLKEIKNIIREDFKSENSKSEKDYKELIEHIKKVYINGNEDSIIENVYLDDIEYPKNIYKILFIASVLIDDKII